MKELEDENTSLRSELGAELAKVALSAPLCASLRLSVSLCLSLSLSVSSMCRYTVFSRAHCDEREASGNRCRDATANAGGHARAPH